MIRVEQEVSRGYFHLFPGIEDTALYSALQGHMGMVLADRAENPSFVFARNGHYCFFGGDPKGPAVAPFLQSLEKGCYLVSFEENWIRAFEKAFGDRLEMQQRFMLKKDMDALDEKHLEGLYAFVPDGMELVAIDERIAKVAFDSQWAIEYVEQYESPEDFVKRGFGYALIKDEDVCCIAPAFSFYDEGIDVGIATNPAYRKQGLATIAAARLVHECKKRGLIANWDAANAVSLRLSQKLGYRLQGEYSVYKIVRE